jgi:hypothetical protein
MEKEGGCQSMKRFASFDSMLKQWQTLTAGERFIIDNELWEFRGVSAYACDNEIDRDGKLGMFRKIGQYTPNSNDPYIGKRYLTDTGSIITIERKRADDSGMYVVSVIKPNGKPGKGYSVFSWELVPPRFTEIQ